MLEWLLLITELLLWHWLSKLVCGGGSLSKCLQVRLAKLCLRLSDRLLGCGARLMLHVQKGVYILLSLPQRRSRLELVLGRPCRLELELVLCLLGRLVLKLVLCLLGRLKHVLDRLCMIKLVLGRLGKLELVLDRLCRLKLVLGSLLQGSSLPRSWCESLCGLPNLAGLSRDTCSLIGPL